MQRWLDCEQTLNEPIDRGPDGRVRVLLGSHSLRRSYRPENRPHWPQEVVWLPRESVRIYGPVSREIEQAFGRESPHDRLPLFLHPQAPASHRRLREAHGSELLAEVFATPTSSYRTVVAWHYTRAPVSLKLSLGAIISGVRRALPERDVASALVISRLLDTIPVRVREQVGFDWFSEPAGLVDKASGTGWLLRKFPRRHASPGAGWMLPAFSLISCRGESPPLLVEMIKRSGIAPEKFVLEKIIRPYVSVLSYLLLEEGIHVEGHTQNVLFEVGDDDALTGRIILRDLSDMSVDIAHRVARQKPLPDLRELVPAPSPFPLATVAGGHRCGWTRSNAGRAWNTVERYGLRGFVWSVNTSLARFYPTYKAAAVERAYLSRWQEHAGRSLQVRPRLRKDRSGIEIEDALRRFHQRTDWENLGARDVHAPPRDVEQLQPTAALPGGESAMSRIESPWGELLIAAGLPVFFVPAFSLPCAPGIGSLANRIKRHRPPTR